MATTSKRKLTVEVPANFTDRDVHKLLKLAAAAERAGRKLGSGDYQDRLVRSVAADNAVVQHLDRVARRPLKKERT